MTQHNPPPNPVTETQNKVAHEVLISRAHTQAQSEWIRQAYFSDPANQFRLEAGEQLLEQGQHNERLFMVLEGELVASRRTQKKDHFIELFRSRPGTFVGTYSFFSRGYCSSARVVAVEPCLLAYIDTRVTSVEPDNYGDIYEQFMPLIIEELSTRTRRQTEEAFAREKATLRLYRAEKMSSLGQMAAGLAHELNNAISTIASKTEYITNFISEVLNSKMADEFAFFQRGISDGQPTSSAELRKRTRQFQQQFKVDRDAARLLARITSTEKEAEQLCQYYYQDLAEFTPYWEMGRDLRDMRAASRHAASIVKSVKVLGAGNFERDSGLDLEKTISSALSLLHSNLRTVQVELDLTDLPGIYASHTELVQIWINLLKNSLDAMEVEATPYPKVEIGTKAYQHYVEVIISDNGPGIPAELQAKVFQPDFTTKKTGLSFGLGLGLAIVQRLVESYGGELQLASRPGHTRFKVKLPIENANE